MPSSSPPPARPVTGGVWKIHYIKSTRSEEPGGGLSVGIRLTRYPTLKNTGQRVTTWLLGTTVTSEKLEGREGGGDGWTVSYPELTLVFHMLCCGPGCAWCDSRSVWCACPCTVCDFLVPMYVRDVDLIVRVVVLSLGGVAINLCVCGRLCRDVVLAPYVVALTVCVLWDYKCRQKRPRCLGECAIVTTWRGSIYFTSENNILPVYTIWTSAVDSTIVPVTHISLSAVALHLSEVYESAGP
jgi:hypothetical protein